jgi:hypothetical protein
VVWGGRVRYFNMIVIIRSQRDVRFCGWKLGHHSEGGSKRGDNVRDNFVLETGEEEDWEFGYRGEVGVGCPDLVAEEGEVSGWWDDSGDVSRIQPWWNIETYEGINFLMDKKVFSNTTPINFPSF